MPTPQELDLLQRIGYNSQDEADVRKYATLKFSRNIVGMEKVNLTRAEIAALDGTNEDVVYFVRSMTSYSTANATTLGLTQDLVTVNQFTKPTSLLVSNVYGFFFNKGVAVPASDGEIVINAWKITLQAWTYGSELITTGDFSGTGLWTVNATWAIAAGVATKTAGNTNQLIQVVAGAAGIYKLVFTVTAVSAGQVNGFITGVSGSARTTAATFIEFVTAPAAITAFAFIPDGSFSGSVDNVSLKARVAQIS